ncbi:MAG: acyl-ACP--UDP-N-acetylglucosamine O-acyltransferase [Candidatus Rokubacteria bacterium]|nr:acyl-ACP--UDP-N-acetylglucosamine O-acyltransferase [Candidatus Rokubacteria bacterium]
MPERIHPSAVIDPRAELGTGVVVGPFTVIGPEVHLGEGTEIGAHVVLEGRVRIGARCRVGHGSIIGAPPQDVKYRPGTPAGVSIGDDTVLREYVTVHHATTAGADTRIGAHCLILTASHIAHDCTVGDRALLINNVSLTGHVTVGERAIIGGMTGIVPFVRIGELAYVGGMSGIRQDVPPFVFVDGRPATAVAVNVIGLRRAGVGPADRRQVQHAFRFLYRSGLAPGAALARVREELPSGHPLVGRLVEFVERSTLGIVAGSARDASGDAAESPEIAR